MIQGNSEIPELEARLTEVEDEVSVREGEIEDLQTPAGIERAARERYGMTAPGEEIYIIPDSTAPDAQKDER